jgi:ABC-type transporter Mla subunit MlaD
MPVPHYHAPSDHDRVMHAMTQHFAQLHATLAQHSQQLQALAHDVNTLNAFNTKHVNNLNKRLHALETTSHSGSAAGLEKRVADLQQALRTAQQTASAFAKAATVPLKGKLEELSERVDHLERESGDFIHARPPQRAVLCASQPQPAGTRRARRVAARARDTETL